MTLQAAPFTSKEIARIQKALRNQSRFWRPKREALNLAREKVQVGVTRKGLPKTRFEYRCLMGCGFRSFDPKGLQVDHIWEVGPIAKKAVGVLVTSKKPLPLFRVDWGAYIQALLCPLGRLRAICRPCHATKTAYYAKGQEIPDEHFL